MGYACRSFHALGGRVFFNGLIVRELPPLTAVFSRMMLAALVLWAVVAALGMDMPRGRRAWSSFFVMGIINNVLPFTLIVWGLGHISSGVAAILNAATPFFTVLVGHRLTRDEKMTPSRLIGVIAGLLGVATLIGQEARGALGVNVTAQVAVLAAALSYAFAGVYGRRFQAMGVTPIATATGQITASSLVLVPLMGLIDRPWTLPPPSLGVVAALLGIAIFSTALAFILYFRILATAGATNLLLVTFLIPVSAIVLGVLFLGEALHPEHLVGMTLIGIGLAAIDGRPWGVVKRVLMRKKPIDERPL